MRNMRKCYLLIIGVLLSMLLQAQTDTHRLTGTVTDEGGSPLPGVTIRIGESGKGVITDLDGVYDIEVVTTDILTFSFIGMEDQLIDVANKSTIDVTMILKANEFDEVTIVAFGQQSKESVVASITSISPQDLKIPSSDLTTSFAGRVAGVISYQRSGEPGQDNAEFFVRGITTFGESRGTPLILIDNMELSSSDLSRLNPDDIETFSVLKDANATALYGARGANGVIMVTTKRGIEGPARVTARVESSISMPTMTIDLVEDPQIYMRTHNEAVRTRTPLNAVPYSEEKIANTIPGANQNIYPYTNWNEELMRKFTDTQRASVNVRGGGKAAKYYVTGSFSNDNGIFNVDQLNDFNNNINVKRFLIRSNVDLNLSKTTTMKINVQTNWSKVTGPLAGGAAMYRKTLNANPVLFPAVYDPDDATQGAKHTLFGNYGDGSYLNPYAELVKGYKEDHDATLLTQFEIHQDLSMLTEGLKFSVRYNMTRKSGFSLQRQYTPYYYGLASYDKYSGEHTLTAINPGTAHEYLTYSEGDKNISLLTYAEFNLNYNRVFKKKHAVNSTLVQTFKETTYSNPGDLLSSLPYRNLTLAGRFSYSYDKRYSLEFNFGYNGSERFDEKYRFGFFPTVGAGWNVAAEEFWINWGLHDISKFKLRASYGMVGNDNMGADRFSYLSNVNMSATGYTFGSEFGYTQKGISVSRYANPDIMWETAYKHNFGFELGIANDFNLLVDVFGERRTNILQTRQDIPTTMGLQATPQANLGEAKSNGFEAELRYNKSFNTHKQWLTVMGNFTFSKGTYTKYEEPDYSDSPWLSREGKMLGQQSAYIAERLFVDDAEVANSPTPNYTVMGGDIKYKDINDDGVIDASDKVYLGYPKTPQIVYGFGFSYGIENFDFSCFFQGSARSSFWLSTGNLNPFSSVDGGNNALPQFIYDSHWSEDNQDVNALWPRLAEDFPQNNQLQSTYYMRDGRFLRLKSAEIGYTFQKGWIDKANIDKFRIYISGSNLITWSPFKLWDPEMAGSTNSSTSGWGIGYPPQRVFNLGLLLNF